MLKPGDTTTMNKEARENYGEQYKGVKLTVTAVATQYMNSKEFFERGQPVGFHPGYDGNGRMPLYDFAEIDFSLYGWEVTG